MNIHKKVTPISIRKLKKFYVIRTRCRYYMMHDTRKVFIYICANDADVLKYPNLYVNKKFIESNMTCNNRYKTHLYDVFENDRHVFKEVIAEYDFILDNFSYLETMTLYSIFESESEYCKWKLRS